MLISILLQFLSLASTSALVRLRLFLLNNCFTKATKSNIIKVYIVQLHTSILMYDDVANSYVDFNSLTIPSLVATSDLVTMLLLSNGPQK